MGISIWQLLIVLVIVLIFFGPSRLEGLGSSLGKAIKGFRKSVESDDKKTLEAKQVENEEKEIS